MWTVVLILHILSSGCCTNQCKNSLKIQNNFLYTMTIGLISNGYIVLIFELRGHLCFPFKIFLMILPIGKLCIESRWFPASQCAGGGGWHGFCPGGGDGSRSHWHSNCWGRAPDPRWRPPPSWIWGWCAGETKHNVCLVPCCIVCTDLWCKLGYEQPCIPFTVTSCNCLLLLTITRCLSFPC